MKKAFFDYMLEIMQDNPDVYFLMCGLGYPRVSEFLEKFPDRAFNTEASEMASMQIAVGLAYAGKIPIVYSISPFLLYRPFEVWRTYINHEKLHVIGVGAGRNDEYAIHDGFSHDASDDIRLFEEHFDEELGYEIEPPPMFKKVRAEWPETNTQMKRVINKAIKSKEPYYINVKRS